MKSHERKDNKKEHASDCTCSICGLKYKGFSFKSGYVCESCLGYIREVYTSGSGSAEQDT